jgi:glycosyltransferase involved in cell wall biosynthesis
VPLVYYSEYSVEVEHEIIAATTPNLLRRWRRRLWANRTERIRRAALGFASGLQCSGVPTYEAYRGLVGDSLMFFDNRVRESEIPRPPEFERRLRVLASSAPLRLAFGGRLVAMKGAGHLPEVAHRLRAAGVDFTFRILGDGDLKDVIRQEISRRQIADRVTLDGAMDFHTGWLPTLREEIDLFVCCHPQGDPSSTYPEVMSCGVPVAGYANAAFRGVLAHGGGGWSVPVNNREALARLLESLARDRGQIAEAARKALTFGASHHFEKTFAARRRQLARLSRLPVTEREKLSV